MSLQSSMEPCTAVVRFASDLLNVRTRPEISYRFLLGAHEARSAIVSPVIRVLLVFFYSSTSESGSIAASRIAHS